MWVISFMLEGECIGVTWIPLLAPLRVKFAAYWSLGSKKKSKPVIQGNKCEAIQNTRLSKASHRHLWYWGSSEENACLLSSVSLPQKERKDASMVEGFHQHCRGSVFLWSVSVAGWSRICLVTRVQRRPRLIPKQGDPPATNLCNYGPGYPKHRNPCQVVILVEHDSPALCVTIAKRLGEGRACWRCNVYA